MYPEGLFSNKAAGRRCANIGFHCNVILRPENLVSHDMTGGQENKVLSAERYYGSFSLCVGLFAIFQNQIPDKSFRG